MTDPTPYPLGIDHEHNVALARLDLANAPDMQRLREAWFRHTEHTQRDPRTIAAKDEAKARFAAKRSAA